MCAAGLCRVVVTWPLLCVNFGSSLCWGDGIHVVISSQGDGRGFFYGWWGFKSVIDHVGEDS